MRVVLIADTFPPLRTSGAVQLSDLSREFVRQSHSLTVLLPSPEQHEYWRFEEFQGVRVLRLRAPKTKNINYFQRTLNEFLMPFLMLWHFKKSPLANEKWDGVIWYSPSIFHGFLAQRLKKASKCKGYLIVRDIFPQWAVDIGLMGRGLPYLFFDVIARYQYSVADVIGVQSPGNLKYFDKLKTIAASRVEVLQNWLDKPQDVRCSLQISKTQLAGRKIFVYAGNMGLAQGLGVLIQLASTLRNRSDLGFLFVGRGSEVSNLKNLSRDLGLDNILFFDEIPSEEIPNLYQQCSVGMVALDPRHKTHNIPGKFLTYIQSGLPVLAALNKGNDLAEMIRDERVGLACESGQVEDLAILAQNLIEQIEYDRELPMRCRALFSREFDVAKTVGQLTSALST